MKMNDPTFVAVVSGLPRSGTSMRMQMLKAGGMPVLTDQLRTADEDNRQGYFEFDPVKRTRRDASWVKGAVGRAVKVIYMLLPDFPGEYEYRGCGNQTPGLLKIRLLAGELTLV
jgi:hypothetical protein